MFDLSPEKRAEAVAFVSKLLSDDIKKEAKALIESDPLWREKMHFALGSWVRSEMREAGLDEDYLGVINLDSVYADLIQEAVG